ncbi:MAG: zinc-dependent metalloprotease [Rikenellaceae bacterium]|jgi:hypothetical protein|nr:zinc-dependent metalloprotease [Rikenellaceae bacterium]
MKKSLSLLFAFALSLSMAPQANAALFKKKKAGTSKIEAAAKPAPPKQSAYDKLMKGATTARSSFITVHKAGGRVFFEIPQKYLGREMLLASTVTEVSEAQFANIGYKPSGTLHVVFEKADSSINLNMVSRLPYTNDANIGKAVGMTNINPVMFSYPVKAYSPDSSAVIEVTPLFTTDVKQFKFFPDALGGLLRINAMFKREASSLGEIKSFEDNLSVKSTLSYSVSVSLGALGGMMGMGNLIDDLPFTAKVTRSFLLLPEKKARPRISDSRVGIFNTTNQTYSLDKQDQVGVKYSLAHRWRVEPKDVEAYKCGELTEPVKQIVFYVDSNFPELWKQPIKNAVERWNMAFEKIGFKNVMAAKDFPTKEEDPEFDPDNLKYSCIRYMPSPTANAMGPSWVDPTTGEIVTASVIVYGNIIQLINNWRFVQTAQLDERVRAKKMPDDVFKESIEYVIAHEIGHCLGFMHNMAASSAFDVEQLRSPEFTKVNGTTPCIMDYARFNYVAQPEDKGVRLTPPDLGIYDYFLIKWNYLYLPQFASEWEEQATVEGWVDEHVGDPIYRYGRQQTNAIYDPSALTEDLGNDPIKAGQYGIKNLKYILANLDGWIRDDNDYTHRQGLYSQIMTQYYRYLYNVMYNIGGIYLGEVKEGTPAERHTPVPKAVQKQSLKWLLDEYKTMTWLDVKQIKATSPMGVSGSRLIRDRLLKGVKGLMSNVALSSYYSDSPYSIDEFASDLFAATWSATGKLTDGDMALQQAMVDWFCESLSEKSSSGGSLLGYAPSVDEIIAYGLDGTGLVERYADVFRKYEQANGHGSVGALLDENDDCCGNHTHFGTPGYGFQSKVTVTLIDNSKGYLQDMAVRSRAQLRSRVASASGADKVFYQSLLIKLNSALKDKI